MARSGGKLFSWLPESGQQVNATSAVLAVRIDYAACMDTRIRSTFPLSIPFVTWLCCALVAYSETPPCSLLTQAQVSTVIGASVGAASPIANTGCSWSTPGTPKVTLSVSMQSEKMFAGAKSPVPPGTTNSSISGLGDEAIFTGVQNFSSLWLKKGTKFVLIRVYGLSVSEAQTKLKAAATNVLSKL